MATLSVAAPQLSVTDPWAGVAAGVVTAPGAIPSRIRTTIPPELADMAVIEIFDTGSVSVRPTPSGASFRSLVAGVVSRRSVAWGFVVGLAVPKPMRTGTPVGAAEPRGDAAKTP